MTDYLDKIISVFLEQGISGAGLLILGYAYYLRGKKLDAKDDEIKDLHKDMLTAAEEDNREKIGYLNQHLVLLTKAKESMSTSSAGLAEVRAKQDQMLNDLSEIRGKLK